MNITKPFRFFPYEDFPFPVDLPMGIGVLITILGVAGFLMGKRKWAVPALGAVLFLAITLGEYLAVQGKAVTIFGHPVPLPYHFLIRDVPLMERLGYPIRAFSLYFFCMIVLAGAALNEIGMRFPGKKIWILLGACLLCLVENLALLPELYSPNVREDQPGAVIEQARSETGDGILCLPYRWNPKYGRFVVYGGKSLVNSYLGQEIPVRSIAYPFSTEAGDLEDRRRALCHMAGEDIRLIAVFPDTEKLLAKDMSALSLLLDPPREFKPEGVWLYRIKDPSSLCNQ